jgi:hypothetical protein
MNWLLQIHDAQFFRIGLMKNNGVIVRPLPPRFQISCHSGYKPGHFEPQPREIKDLCICIKDVMIRDTSLEPCPEGLVI